MQSGEVASNLITRECSVRQTVADGLRRCGTISRKHHSVDLFNGDGGLLCSSGPAVAVNKTMRPVKAVQRVAIVPGKVLEINSAELVEWFGIETVSLAQEACQHITLAMCDINGFGSAVEHRSDQPLPVGMVAENETSLIASTTTGSTHCHPSRGKGCLR